MKGISKIIKEKEKEFITIKMEIDMKEDIRTVNKKDKMKCIIKLEIEK